LQNYVNEIILFQISILMTSVIGTQYFQYTHEDGTLKRYLKLIAHEKYFNSTAGCKNIYISYLLKQSYCLLHN